MECNAPMRRWRLALNVRMEEVDGQSEVHVKFGAQVAMVGHTFELPKQAKPSSLASVFSKYKTIDEAKVEISKWVTQQEDH